MCVCKTKQKLDDMFPMHYSKFVSLTCTKRYKLDLLFGEADELKYNRACKDQRQSEESQETFHLNIWMQHMITKPKKNYLSGLKNVI